MKRLHSLIWIFALAVGLVVIGCGAEEKEESGEGGGAAWPVLPEEIVEEVTSLSIDDLAEASEGGCLGAAQSSITGSGGTFVVGGVTRGSGVEVFWAAHVDADGRDVAALQICEEESCRCVIAEVTPTSLVVSALDGGDSSLPVVGAPVLAKTLQGTDLAGETQLAAVEGALIEETVTGTDAARFQGKRRFLVANAYGPEFGVEFSRLTSAADDSGLFTEVGEERRVGANRMDEVLRDFHAQDVLVWAGAGVRQFKGGGSFKPEGVTVNAGVYGDLTYDRERIATQLRAAPLGGPGLIVLLGSETFGTLLEGMAPWGSVANLLQGLEERPRALVGVRGQASANDTLSSVASLVDALLAGESLLDAIAAGNGGMAAAGSSALWVTNLGDAAASKWVLAPAMKDFWGGANPSSGQFVGELLISGATQCTDASGALAPAVEKKIQFFADVAVDGPFFSGEKSLGDVEFSVFGIIGGLHPGGAVRFWVDGSHGDVQDVVVLGDGRFCSQGECVGDVTGESDFKPGGKLYFGGTAEATAYQDGQGGSCKPSSLFLLQKGGKPGWIIVEP